MPQIQVLQCPSCGANLSYEGGPETTVTCQFCGAAVVVPPELRAAAPAAPSAPPIAPSAPVSTPPVYTPPVPPSIPTQAAMPSPAIRRAGRVAGCSGLGCVGLIIAGIVAFFVAMFYLPIRLSGSYQQAVDAVRSDPEAVRQLGAPVEVSWWVPSLGAISCSGSSCRADYDIYIHGSRGTGHIYVWSRSVGWTLFSEGTWILRYDLHVDNPVPTAVKPSSTPVPTLSSQQIEATQVAQTQDARGTQEMASARAAATATAQRQAVDDATATVVAQATGTAEAEAAIQADIATQEGWPVLYSDSFANNQLGWPTGSTSKQGLVITNTLSQKSFLWQVVPGHGGFVHAFPHNCPTLTDFTASVRVTFTKVDENGRTHFGLVFRESGDQYGFFGLNGGGGYWIRQGTSFMYDSIRSSNVAINSGPGQSNKLTVRVLGTDVIFAINDQVVRLLDDQLPGGRVGVGAEWEENGSQPVIAQFNDFEVRAPK